jgi:hypothetical protein
MKPSQVQLIRIASLSIAVIAMLLLAMGISQLELVPGVPFDQIWQFLLDQLLGDRGSPFGFASIEGNADLLVKILRTIFLLALITFPFALIIIIINPEERKRLLRTILVMALLFSLGSMWMNRLTETAEEDPLSGFGMPGMELGGEGAFTDEEFDVESVPTWIPFGLSLTVGLIIAIIVVSVVRQIRRNRADRVPSPEAFAKRARAALGEIEQGSDLRNTILRCYVEMIQIVREQRGIRRGSTVTAHEFTDHLIRANLPPRAVHRLTELFEVARYGQSMAGLQDEADAVASLQAIIDACRTTA